MYGPRVIVSMSVVLVVFAAATYFLSGSSFTTLWQTVLCAILLQVGYFIGVLLLVAREKAARAKRQEQGRGAGLGEADVSNDMGAGRTPNLKIRDR